MATRTVPLILPKDKAWPVQGEWEYEDYLRLPDDGRRYEIIEGVLYVTNAPSFAHQFAVSKIFMALARFIEASNLGVVLTGPFEIHLPGIAKPVLPDIVYISTEKQPDPDSQFFEGAPDLVVEVLSPSTFRVDQSIKLDAYERAGVSEYWLADPKTRSITVYILPTGGQEFALLGQFASDETINSKVLTGLELTVDTLFTQ